MSDQNQEPEFIDLSGLDENLRLQEEGIDVAIVDHTNKPTGLIIWVYGPDSRRAQEAVRELQAEIEKEAAKAENLDLDSADAQKDRSIRYLAKVTKGWNKPIGADRLQFSEENAKLLYGRYPIIENQVRFKADRRSSFIKS